MVTRRGFLSGAWARPARTEARIDAQCLAVNGIVCRSCAEACPVDLIRFRPAVGGISLPIIAVDGCDGCAACVPACPVRAIAMRPSTTILERVAT